MPDAFGNLTPSELLEQTRKRELETQRLQKREEPDTPLPAATTLPTYLKAATPQKPEKEAEKEFSPEVTKRQLNQSRLRQKSPSLAGQEAKTEDKIAATAAGGTVSQTSTGWLLKTAWFTVIPTFGLSLILYGNFHAFMAYLWPGPFKEMFCRFGREWTLAGKTGPLVQVSQKSRAALALEIVELSGLVLLDLLALALIGLLITVIYFILQPCQAALAFGGGIGGLLGFVFRLVGRACSIISSVWG